MGSTPNATRIHATIHHPSLAAIPQDKRGTPVFLLLDALLGEDDVERWIGEVNWQPDANGQQPIGALAQAAADLAARRPPEAEWTLASGTLRDGRPIIFRTQIWARWLDRPLLDLHSRVTLNYRARPDGLPDEEESARLEAAEDRLVAAVGAFAELVTVTTGGGQRAFDLYSDSEDQNHASAVEHMAREIRATVSQSPDPTWKRGRVLE
jgi:hypothetical protein